MSDERTSLLFCSHCEMPVFPDEEDIIWLYLNPVFGLIFCDLGCCKEFMKDLSYEEIEAMQGDD